MLTRWCTHEWPETWLGLGLALGLGLGLAVGVAKWPEACARGVRGDGP